MNRVVKLNTLNPDASVSLTFTPSMILVYDNTDVPVYFTIGGTGIPGELLGFHDRKVLPRADGLPSNIMLPNVSYEFGLHIPTPGDPQEEVTVIFQGTSDPFTNKSKNPF
jgi:hypothetical protein